MPDLLVRRLEPSDGPALIELRLLALTESPDAFGASFEEFGERGPEGRLSWAQDCLGTGVWGAFPDGRLVGMVGIRPGRSL